MREVTHKSIVSDIRHAGTIKRYHTWPILRQQTIGEHTWQVLRIYRELWGSPPSDVWEYILLHDVAELGTGDVPFYVKRATPALKEALDAAEREYLKSLDLSLPVLTDVEWRRFKLCDVLEMFEFGCEELMMGNRFAAPIISNTKVAIWNMMSDNKLSDDETRRIKRFIQVREDRL